MLSHMVKDLLRFAFLYLEFYLPFGKKIVTFYTVTGISLVFEDSFMLWLACMIYCRSSNLINFAKTFFNSCLINVWNNIVLKKMYYINDLCKTFLQTGLFLWNILIICVPMLVYHVFGKRSFFSVIMPSNAETLVFGRRWQNNWNRYQKWKESVLI